MVNKDSQANMVNNVPVNAIDPYALVEALTGFKLDRRPMTSTSAASDLQADDYDDLAEMRHDSLLSDMSGIKPDEPPKHIHVGCINPYALVEAVIGRKIDKCSVSSARIISDVLQTDYDELFDMKHDSVLHAGLKLNKDERRAEELTDKDIKILNEDDLSTPDLSGVRKPEDLEKLGMKDIRQAHVKMARMQNGKVCLVLHAHDMGKTVSNRDVTMTVNELALPFRKEKGPWTPPNTSWQDMYKGLLQGMTRRKMTEMDAFQMVRHFHPGACMKNKFDDPVQGALSNSWLIAAIHSVFWADPSSINRRTHISEHVMRYGDREEKKRIFSVKFHDKGGANNAPTATVEVNYEIPINNSDNEPVYCRASDESEIWPSLYEKAFAKWITGTSSNHPDLTQTYNGDPIKAMAQINGKSPKYYMTERHHANELAGLVRRNSVNFKTINPMAAYTYPSGNRFRGSNLVANHAYSVLGWASCAEHQYIILRNPWGVTEPAGITSYPGLVPEVKSEFWPPAPLLDCGGVLALEASAFKEYFACIGVAK